MKFRQEHSVDFHFTEAETFKLSAANGFQLMGRSINDILQISLPQLQVNATTTRNLRKRSFADTSENDSELSSDYESQAPKRSRIPSVEIDQLN